MYCSFRKEDRRPEHSPQAIIRSSNGGPVNNALENQGALRALKTDRLPRSIWPAPTKPFALVRDNSRKDTEIRLVRRRGSPLRPRQPIGSSRGHCHRCYRWCYYRFAALYATSVGCFAPARPF